MIDISDDKVLGLKRKVEELSFLRDKESTQIVLSLRMHYFKNNNGAYGEEVTDKIQEYKPRLIASGNTFVDPQTGAYAEPIKEIRNINGEDIEVEVGYPEGTITMYQFYSNIQKSMVEEYTEIIKGVDLMIPIIVAQEDAKGTFDNV